MLPPWGMSFGGRCGNSQGQGKQAPEDPFDMFGCFHFLWVRKRKYSYLTQVAGKEKSEDILFSG